jgi:hypothetical protein
MQHSEHINELASALAKAQGEVTGALKDSANPFFKSRYADLASCWDACREPLSKNGLAIIQSPEVNAEGLTLTTLLTHSTGQWIKNVFRIMPKDDTPQGVGSALTYARRYALTALIGIAQVDDDGNAASGRANGHAIEAPGKVVELGKDVPLDKARSTALAMLAIIDKPAADGDHDETLKAKDALDYHDKVLVRDEDLYVAAGKQLSVAKKNVWSALVRKAREAEKLDKASDPTRARTF